MTSFTLKGFLGGLVGGNRPHGHHGRQQPVARVPARAHQSRPGSANVATLRPAATAPKHKHYRSESDLPKWKEVASLPAGKLPLSQQARAAMFILELEAKTPANAPMYCVVSTTEHYASQAYKDAMDRVREIGGVPFDCGVADTALVARFSKDSVEMVGRTEESSRMIKAATDLIAAARAKGSSDIHIESRESGAARVRMRINGRMTLHSDSWQHDFVVAMGRAMHFVAEVDSKPEVFSSDCNFSVVLDLGGSQVQARVEVTSTFPKGIDIVMRIQERSRLGTVPTLEQLGMAESHIEDIEEMLSKPSSMIVAVGITGSGKTTTLYTLMERIRLEGQVAGRDTLKLISIESPPEIEMTGVSQIPTDPDRYNHVLKKVLRMDPDGLMVGEVRDAEAADLLSQFVLSGHKTLTSLHAPDNFDALYRLAGMGIPRDVMGANGFLGGFIAQALVPTLCPHCKVPYSAASKVYSESLHERIAKVTYPGDQIFTESESGCEECGHSGIGKRTVCAETLLLDDAMRAAIRDGSLSDVKGIWSKLQNPDNKDSMRGRSRLDHAILKMRRGILSPRHVEKELGLLTVTGVHRA